MNDDKAADAAGASVRDLDECRGDIFRDGVWVATVHSIGADATEAWVRAVRGWSQCDDVDWHYVGGRAVVRALGDADTLDRVREACAALMPAANEILRALYPMTLGSAGEVRRD